jgi:LuxR family transcriptional regulator of csgAB operon
MVLIVGKQRILNELAAGLLKRELRVDCAMYESLPPDARFLEQGVNGNGSREPGVPVAAEDVSRAHAARDLAILDTAGGQLQEVIRDLNARYRVLMRRFLIALFNVAPGTGMERRAVEHGVSGFFYTSDPPEVFVKGVRTLLTGQLWVTRKVLSECVLNRNGAGSVSRDFWPAEQNRHDLTRREMELLSYVALGKTNEQISEELFISTHTVKTHLYHIFKKIKVSDRLQAAFWAAQNL